MSLRVLNKQSTNQEILLLDAEQIPEVSERKRSVTSEGEVPVVMRGSCLRSLPVILNIIILSFGIIDYLSVMAVWLKYLQFIQKKTAVCDPCL